MLPCCSAWRQRGTQHKEEHKCSSQVSCPHWSLPLRVPFPSAGPVSPRAFSFKQGSHSKSEYFTSGKVTHFQRNPSPLLSIDELLAPHINQWKKAVSPFPNRSGWARPKTSPEAFHTSCLQNFAASRWATSSNSYQGSARVDCPTSKKLSVKLRPKCSWGFFQCLEVEFRELRSIYIFFSY